MIFIILTMIAISRILDDNLSLFPFGLYWLLFFLLIIVFEALPEATKWLDNAPAEASSSNEYPSGSSKSKKRKGRFHIVAEMIKEFSPLHWTFTAFVGAKKILPIFFITLTTCIVAGYLRDLDKVLFPFGLYWLISFFLIIIFESFSIQLFKFESSEAFREMSGQKILILIPSVWTQFSGEKCQQKIIKINPLHHAKTTEKHETTFPLQKLRKTGLIKKERSRLVKVNLTESELVALKACLDDLSARFKKRTKEKLHTKRFFENIYLGGASVINWRYWLLALLAVFIVFKKWECKIKPGGKSKTCYFTERFQKFPPKQ